MTSNSPSLPKLTEDRIPILLEEIEQAFFNIPFENSTFQTENFVIASQVTPERAYRAIGLRMSSKIRALKETKYGRMKEDIDIEELQQKVQNPHTSSFDRRRAEIDIQQKLDNRKFTDKLINDAIDELNVLYHHFQRLPKYTREQFEQGEKLHFENKLTRQIQGISGAQESLVNMQTDLKQLQSFEQETVNHLLEQQQNQLIRQWEEELKGEQNGTTD